MATVVTAIILCFINILLWIIFAIRFKKIFTTDEIIEKTREELNQMLADVNRNAERNITLIEDKIRELKSVAAEADRRLSVYKTELEKEDRSKALETKIESNVHAKTTKASVSTAAEKYLREQVQGDLFVSEPPKKRETATVQGVHPIPIISPQVYLSDNPIEPKKDFNTQVKEKYEKGESVEDIAAELGRSTQEVKFALEFS